MIGGPGEGNLLTRTLRDERNRRERGRRQGDEKVYLARDVGLEGIIVLGRMAAEHGRVPMQAIAVSEEGVGSVGEARAGVAVGQRENGRDIEGISVFEGALSVEERQIIAEAVCGGAIESDDGARRGRVG